MQKKRSVETDPLDREIDFSNARPNPCFVWYHGARVVRVLEPDLAELFPDDASVSSALRTVAEAAARMRPEKVSAKTAAAPQKTAKKVHS